MPGADADVAQHYLTSKDYSYKQTLVRNRRRPPPVVTMPTSLSCVGMVWTVLSFVTMAISCVGFYMPHWIEGALVAVNNTPASFGTFRRCTYPKLVVADSPTLKGGQYKVQGAAPQVVYVNECGRYTEFKDIPSVWWQIATVTVGVGCAINILVSFTALLGCCMDDVITEVNARVAGVLQFLAGVLIGIGLSLHPLGWENSDVRQVCGPTAGIFKLGSCRLSWAFYTAVAAVGASFFSALFSCHSSQEKQLSSLTAQPRS